ncbi:molybdopterin biosynthesis protein MoeB [Streptococcus parauberis]|uniref:rhodanese-like domain-containing protein n=1 Tax=Streptococcus parauberis TaxID=1348 RepID=UPI00097703AB|nr:rhodanese-like domain-containing protein [Streptococcus parauberis]ONH62908.1 molybdopterin biosynthesis protein MoeB [Streptococcus parauberis]PCH13935.1 molybdopterin biosynthesis protein MoeB [Streptococcus parauberis]
MSTFTIILWIIIVAIAVYFAYNYFTFKRMAKQIGNDEFKEMMHYSQVIDLRDPVSFRKKHIIGARNFPGQQFDGATKALLKDKPILIYETSRSTLVPSAVRKLRKAGFNNLYVLRDGIDYWDGKVKESK